MGWQRAPAGWRWLVAGGAVAVLVALPGLVGAVPARLGHLGLRVEPFTTDDALLATAIYARDRRHLLSLADRCCLATAIRLRLPAVAGDRAWSTLDLGVEVLACR